ncbi:hypothetical protein AAVH_36026, partial [Aphelenchoides avenae]
DGRQCETDELARDQRHAAAEGLLPARPRPNVPHGDAQVPPVHQPRARPERRVPRARQAVLPLPHGVRPHGEGAAGATRVPRRRGEEGRRRWTVDGGGRRWREQTI